MKKKTGDPRITVKMTSALQYFVTCLVITCLCAALLAICLDMMRQGQSPFYIILAAITFLLLANAVIIYLTAFFRIRFFKKQI